MSHPAPGLLPTLSGSPAIGVSGLSSGADMAAQLLLAYSSLFAGGGIFAGQAWHCAVQRFAEDSLVPLNSSSNVPFCDGCPSGQTLDYDHCKKAPIADVVGANVSLLVAKAEDAAATGLVDPVEQLAARRVFLYRGSEDTIYNEGSVRGTNNFFAAFNAATSFVTHVQSGHLLPAIEPFLCSWQEWSGPDNCTFDGAGAALRWVHGDAALASGRDNDTAALATRLQAFDQRPFFPESGDDPLLDDEGLVFVPGDCSDMPGTASRCAVHLFLHGCGVDQAWHGRTNFEAYAEYSGFNNWAARNRIIVVYPKMATSGRFAQQHAGCWDGYGQTGHDYDLKEGLQMQTLARIAEHFALYGERRRSVSS